MTDDNLGWHLCSACRTAREDVELLMFWPIEDPEVRRFVCRPSIDGRCFREKVGDVSRHAIRRVGP